MSEERIFEGTEQIQPLVISRATSGLHIEEFCAGLDGLLADRYGQYWQFRALLP